MTLTPEQKDHAVELIEMGDKLEAVRYLQQTLYITVEQALILAEKLEEEVETSPLPDELQSFEEIGDQQPGINVGRLVGIIFMSIGGIILAVVAYLAVSNYKFAQRALPVKGKVVDYNHYESPNSKGGGSTLMYTPIFEYSFNGKPYQYKSSTSTSSQEYEIGETVEILVDPLEPQIPLINTFWEKWFLSVLLGFMGVLFAGMGYLAFRVFGRSKRLLNT